MRAHTALAVAIAAAAASASPALAGFADYSIRDQTLTAGPAAVATGPEQADAIGCTVAVAKLEADLAACVLASSQSSTEYYKCVCQIGSLISDIQSTFNECPASTFNFGTSTAGLGFSNPEQLYSTCVSMGFTLSSLTNVPTAISLGSNTGSATGSSSNSKATGSTSTTGGAPSTNRPGVVTAAAAGLAAFASVILF